MRWVDRVSLLFVQPEKFVRINPYLFVFLSVCITLFVRWLLDPFLGDTAPLLLFIIPIILSSGYGGFLPGISATIMGMLASDFFFIAPYLRINIIDKEDLIRFFLFLIIGIFISILSEARNVYEKRLDHSVSTEQLAKRNAEQQTRIREHFISVASHELKSPITSQKMYLEILKKRVRKNSDKKYEQYIQKIEAQTDKLTNFIDDLLDVSKMSSKRLHYRFSEFSIREVLDDAMDQIQNLLVNHKIILKGKSRRKILGDKERLSQVITNLLSNAIKYSPEKTEVIVWLSETNKELTLGIQDFGIGIDKKYQHRIFNRFFRITGSDETTFKGFGLGLYLSAEIIKKHKGKIWVESQIGKGSTFFFTLPVRKKK